MFDTSLHAKIAQLANYLKKRQFKLGVAESCTGGGLSYLLTETAGSSEWFDRGLITYSNEAKMALLAVQKNTLIQYGAVSEEIAREMVEGLLWNHPLDVGIAITGIAGPKGGSPEKPIGTVWIASAIKGRETKSISYLFKGDRHFIRTQSIVAAINELLLLYDIM